MGRTDRLAPAHGTPPAGGTDPVHGRLLKAALDLLVRQGPDALTVRSVADTAGMSTMNVYSRFGGKNGLIDHVLIEGFRRLGGNMHSVRRPDEPVTDLREAGAAYRRFAHDNPAHYSVMFSGVFPDHQRSAEAVSAGQAAFRELIDVITNGMGRGVFHCADALQASARVWATVHGVVSLEMKAPPLGIDWDEVFETSTSTLLITLTTPANR